MSIPERNICYDPARKMKADATHLTLHDLTPRPICELEGDLRPQVVPMLEAMKLIKAA